MQNRRDRLVKYLQEADLNPVLPGGGYFIVADISKLGLYTTLSSLFNEHVFVFISNIYKLHMCYSMHHFYKQKEVFYEYQKHVLQILTLTKMNRLGRHSI